MFGKSTPIVVQLKGIFNAEITLTELNYGVWSQLMEMHIVEQEKNSYLSCHVKPLAKTNEDMTNGMPKIKSEALVVDVYEPRNNEALYTLTHCPRNMECFIEILL